jgi:hypothetical protein
LRIGFAGDFIDEISGEPDACGCPVFIRKAVERTLNDFRNVKGDSVSGVCVAEIHKLGFANATERLQQLSQCFGYETVVESAGKP